ncbi:MAG: hypothetical protein DI533_20410 [Cereibacter sphaeroides]|uniref:Terminase small subunit n=1 Tax=Cereibacter sphaeroides TaxID=1063 RepID=A0A2W5RYV6_CERSP|nr:MAG: hypothetical protein DI533_20410 [Cereibacter sphaeroides]WPK30464.1 hypothetical protein SLP22_00064 [Salmonella phage BAU.Micro_SLP-22]
MAKASPVALRQRRSNQNDVETEAMLFQGANITQLGKLFRMERRDITAKISGNVPPCGERGGYPIYFIHEVAPHIVKPIYDIETYLKRMHHNDLPKHLSKEFWAGLRQRQEYLKAEGDLWETDKVIEVMADAFKTLRMTLLLAGDTVEREMTLTHQQRDKLRVIFDGALNDLADSLVNRFADRAKKEVIDDDEI